MKISTISSEKFNMLHSGAVSMKSLFTGIRYFNGKNRDDLDSQEHLENSSKAYEKGLQVKSIITGRYEPDIEYGDETMSYMIGTSLIEDCAREHTQVFATEKGGISTICLSDSKETIIISAENGTVLHRKTGNRIKIIEQLLLKELNTTARVAYLKGGIVETQNFRGIYERLNKDYLLVKFYAFGDYIKSGLESYTEHEGFSYMAIVDCKTIKVVHNKIYKKVQTLVKGERIAGLYACEINGKFRKRVGDLIDIENDCREVLRDVEISEIHGYIIADRILNKKENALAVYQFDEQSRKLVTVVPEVKNVFIRDNSVNAKEKDRNIMLSHRPIGACRDGNKMSLAVTIYTHRDKDSVVWSDTDLYEQVKHEIGSEVL